MLIPPLYGLVLSGGNSSRMGEDKSLISYHGKQHAIHIADLLTKVCKQTYLSRKAPGPSIAGYSVISDIHSDKGPLGGILSAFEFNDKVAWFTVACDMPLLDMDTLMLISENRDPCKKATCFIDEDSGLLQPLITIWEPSIFMNMKNQFSDGSLSPRKLLSKTDVNSIKIENSYKLKDCNTPSDKDFAIKMISRKLSDE